MEVTEIKETTSSSSYKILTKEAECGNVHEENVVVNQNGYDGEPYITFKAGTDWSLYVCELIAMLGLLGISVTPAKSAGRPPKRHAGRPKKNEVQK